MNTKKKYEHPLRNIMINRFLSYVRNEIIEDNTPIKNDILIMFSTYPYKEIVRPLITVDRLQNKLTYGQLKTKYQLSMMQLKFMMNENNSEE